MTDDNPDVTPSKLASAILDGVEDGEATLRDALEAISRHKPILSAKHLSGFLWKLVTTETPSDPDEIAEMSKEELRFAVMRINFFGNLRLPVVDDDQLEHLYQRVIDLWGEYPTEPLGRWAEWCLWTHRQRRLEAISLKEVVAGEQTAHDLFNNWVTRRAERAEQRKLRQVNNYQRYSSVEEVPDDLIEVVMSPFIQEGANERPPTNDGDDPQSTQMEPPMESAGTITDELASLDTGTHAEITLRVAKKPDQECLVSGPVTEKNTSTNGTREQVTIHVENNNDNNADWLFQVRPNDYKSRNGNIAIKRDVQTNDGPPTNLSDTYTVLWVSAEETPHQ